MYEDMLFSLSYEQMTQMAEEEIKQCDFAGMAPIMSGN
jgi:hypothetical protein